MSRYLDLIGYEVYEQNEVSSEIKADSSLTSYISSPVTRRHIQLSGDGTVNSRSVETAGDAVHSRDGQYFEGVQHRSPETAPADLEPFADLLEAVDIGDVPHGNFTLYVDNNRLIAVTSLTAFTRHSAKQFTNTQQRQYIEDLELCQSAWRRWKAECAQTE